MLTRSSVAPVAAVCAFLGACTSESLPPELGDCTPTGDASCMPSNIGSGALAGASEGGSAACNAGASASQCDVCANANCCTPLTACAASTPCNNLLSCVTGCAGASACVSGCEGTYPDSVATLNAIDSCVALKCVICSESGVGDPCAAYACMAGLTCPALWCTKACARSADCAGIGPNGGNFTGAPNACMSTARGELCAPGCASNADCADFVGTFCVSTTSFDGLAVSICSTLPDGG
jgi:hypothetical protein